jgi:hypothetical protein
MFPEGWYFVVFVRTRLRTAILIGAVTLVGVLPLATLAPAASASTAKTPASCTSTWTTEYTVAIADTPSGTVSLQYQCSTRDVRANASDLPTGTVCFPHLGCGGTYSEDVWVYNQNTGATAGNSDVTGTSYTSPAIGDANTTSHACASESGGTKSCTAYF